MDDSEEIVQTSDQEEEEEQNAGHPGYWERETSRLRARLEALHEAKFIYSSNASSEPSFSATLDHGHIGGSPPRKRLKLSDPDEDCSSIRPFMFSDNPRSMQLSPLPSHKSDQGPSVSQGDQGSHVMINCHLFPSRTTHQPALTESHRDGGSSIASMAGMIDELKSPLVSGADIDAVPSPSSLRHSIPHSQPGSLSAGKPAAIMTRTSPKVDTYTSPGLHAEDDRGDSFPSYAHNGSASPSFGKIFSEVPEDMPPAAMDPLRLFTPQKSKRRRSMPSPASLFGTAYNSVRSEKSPTSLLPSSTQNVVNRSLSPLSPIVTSSPLRGTPPLRRNASAHATRHPSSPRSPSSRPEGEPSHTDAEAAHMHEADLAAEQHGRYSLRTRKARQLHPYNYDKQLYERQLRSNPDAIVKFRSPRRRRHDSPGAVDDDHPSSDVDFEQPDSDVEHDLESSRRRQGKQRASHSVAEGDAGARHPAPDHSPTRWYPSVFNDALSSSEEDDLSADLQVARGEAQSSKQVRERPRARLKPFPMRKKNGEFIQDRSDKGPSEPGPSSPRVISVDGSDSDDAPIAPPGPRPKSRSQSLSYPPPLPSSPAGSIELPPWDLPLPDLEVLTLDDSHSQSDFPPTSSNPSSDHVVTQDNFDHIFSDLEVPINEGLLENPDAPSEAPEHPSEGSSNETASDLESPKMSTKELKRSKILHRMFPKSHIAKLLNPARGAPSWSHATRRMPENDDEQPLQPGHTRVRAASHPRDIIEIRGDSESSDEERKSPSPSLHGEHVTVEDQDESHAATPMVRQRHYIEISSSDSELDEGGSVGDVDDAEVRKWVSGAVRSSWSRNGEAREENLIDRMLSRANISRSNKKRKASPRSLKVAKVPKRHRVDVVAGGARKQSAQRQTLLDFGQRSGSSGQTHSSSGGHRSSYIQSHKPSGTGPSDRQGRSLSADPDIVQVTDTEQPIVHQVVQLDTSFRTVAKKKDRRQQRNGAGLYVFTSAGGHVTSGRTHGHAYTVDAEREESHRTTIRFGEARRSRVSPPTANRTQMVPMKRTADINNGLEVDLIPAHVAPSGSASPEPVAKHTDAQAVTLDFGIPFLPSGLAFGPKSCLAKGWLAELTSVGNPDSDVTQPVPGAAHGHYYSASIPLRDFLEAFGRICDVVFETLIATSQSLSSADCQQWQNTFHSLSQHVTWFLAHSEPDGSESLRKTVERQVRRTREVIEERFAVRSDESFLNLLAYEVQWFAIELSWRARPQLQLNYSEPSSSHDIQLLMKHLWAYGFERPLESTYSLGSRELESSCSSRAAELWICLIHLTLASSSAELSPSSANKLHSFWGALMEVLQDANLLRLSISELEASERTWRTIFSLCCLSQFTIHGLSTSTPRLTAGWAVVDFAFQKVRLSAEAVPSEESRRVPMDSHRKRDRYFRLLISRCMILNRQWKWRLDHAAPMFNRLVAIFKSRRFANLCDEGADFPHFLRLNNIQLLSEQRRNDTAFTMFLKLIVQAAKESSQASNDERQIRLPQTVKKILSLAVPVGTVPFDKATPPSKQELSMLYNRLSFVAVAIYLEPIANSVKNWLVHARRYVDFKNTNFDTRRAYIRGLMHLAIMLRHLHLPLTEISAWLAEMTDILIKEYCQPDVPSHDGVRDRVMLCVQLLLGSVRLVVENPVMDPSENITPYPDPALIHGSWLSKILSTILLTISPTTRLEIRKLLQAFLQARAAALPAPGRPHVKPVAVAAESQESQDDYGQFDLDLNDPELLAALGDGAPSELIDGIKAQEKVVSEIIDSSIFVNLFTTVCRHFNECGANDPPLEEDYHNADEWIDCLVGCASVVVKNGRRDWSKWYLSIGPQSWEPIKNSCWRRRVGLRCMYTMLRLDPCAYLECQPRFLGVLLESLVTAKVTFEHQYVALVFTIDGLQHILLKGLVCERAEGSQDYNISEVEFMGKRVTMLEHIFSNLESSLAKEAAGEILLADENQICLGFLLSMFSTMRGIHQHFDTESIDHGEYSQFCKMVFHSLKPCPRLLTHSRLQSPLEWLRTLP